MTIPHGLLSLFQVSPLRVPNKSEESIQCVQFANTLRALTLEGRMKAVWFHVTNESTGDKRFHWQTLKRLEGRLPGIPDYIFLGKHWCGAIEFKSPKGRLSESQLIIKQWFDETGVPWALCRSSQEGIEKLNAWGIIR